MSKLGFRKHLKWLPVLASLLFVGVWLVQWFQAPDYNDDCLALSDEFVVCAASDMAKLKKTSAISLEHPDFDLGEGAVKLHAARNETVALQLLVRRLATDKSASNAAAGESYTVSRSHWNDASGTAVDALQSSLFEAHYHFVANGGYTWGPGSDGALDWPAYYPDALVPQQHGCLGANKQLLHDFKLPTELKSNSALWVDVFVPPELEPGIYRQTLSLTVGEHTVSVPLELSVAAAQLPATPSIHAVGEVYRAYHVEGVGYDIASDAWRDMSQCYQQLAHQHRMVFIERTPDFVENQDWSTYDEIFAPALSGELFTQEYGYQGTGEAVPVGVWRTPWPQAHDMTMAAAMPTEEADQFAGFAQSWSQHAQQAGWDKTSFFAYVFDEVDGPDEIESVSKAHARDYIKRVHADMQTVQSKIDSGVALVDEAQPIDLIWTSHSNPAIWAGDAELDLAGKVRLWAPNASAADVDFLSDRIAQGEQAWFYHSGQPAVGAHAINFPGIEMRTWGVIGARYGFQGQFMWAVNLGNNDKPFAEPIYKPEEDRFGNGVIVYPGNALSNIGYPSSPGPLPSMRMKLWRRGLQDADLFYLAVQNNEAKAQQLIKEIMPRALADGRGKPAWSHESADWIEFHKRLLELASGS